MYFMYNHTWNRLLGTIRGWPEIKQIDLQWSSFVNEMKAPIFILSKIGCCPLWTVPIVLAFLERNSLPLGLIHLLLADASQNNLYFGKFYGKNILQF